MVDQEVVVPAEPFEGAGKYFRISGAAPLNAFRQREQWQQRALHRRAVTL
jgi:hypothetical protein